METKHHDISIRGMKESDLSDVSQIFLETFNFEGEEWSEKTAYDHVKQNYFGDAHWVAESEGKIIGFLMGMILVREKGEELFVDSVAVSSDYQKKGIGTLLWKKTEEYVKEKQLVGLRLLANPSFGSYSWYKSMGFKPSGWVELSNE